MTPCEVRTVKRRLEAYQDLLAMANEKDREALLLQAKYEDLATPGCIRYDREPTGGGSGKTKETVYNEIFSDQAEAERKAKEYRAEAEKVKKFISLIDDDAKPIIEDAYIHGKRYKTIAKEKNYSPSGVRLRVYRCLQKVPASLAEACGLL